MPPNSASVRTSHGKWLMIATVGNLEITKDIQSEFRVGRVTLITPRKLRRTTKRFGIHKQHWQQKGAITRLLDGHNALAVLHQTGIPDRLEDAALKQIRTALDILAASQLYVRRRSQMAAIGLTGESHRGVNTHMLLNCKNLSLTATSSMVGRANTLCLDKSWTEVCRSHLFARLLKLTQESKTLKPHWKAELLRAAQLIGKGINSYDMATAFTWNMVALEVLLCRRNDHYSKEIPRRVEALLGWVANWGKSEIEQRLRNAYDLRCRVVHAGEHDAVAETDVEFTEHILFNVLNNLLRHPKLFPNKESLIQFADLLSAERLLGLKPRVRPKTLMYFERRP